MNNEHPRKSRQWLKEPSSWLALVATCISISTFFLVYAFEGELRVILPDRVGIGLDNGYLTTIVPITFTNTGAPRTVRHVRQVKALVEPKVTTNTKNPSITMFSLQEKKFVGNDEYLKMFPEKETEYADCKEHENSECLEKSQNKSDCEILAEDKCRHDDQAVYVSRPVPFPLFGEDSAAKVYQFIQEADVGSPVMSVIGFYLQVIAFTEKESTTSYKAYYDCKNDRELSRGSVTYCRINDPKVVD